MGSVRVAFFHVFVKDDLELLYDAITLESCEEFAVDVDGSFGLFEGSGKRDADVGVFGLSGAIDDAAHDGELELLDARVLLLPLRHGGHQIGLDAFRQLLKVSRCSPAAAGAARHLGHEAADAERLQDLLAAADFFGAVAAGGGGQADADGVADSGEEQRGLRPAVLATMPFMPMPASVRPRCRA